jgi:hypothetical protein
MQKLCSICSQPAHFSINVLVSTVGGSKRLQQSSPAALFCDACIQKSSDRSHSSTLRKLVFFVAGYLRSRDLVPLLHKTKLLVLIVLTRDYGRKWTFAVLLLCVSNGLNNCMLLTSQLLLSRR